MQIQKLGSTFEDALMGTMERNQLILECIEVCEQIDTVVTEDHVGRAHDAAAKLRAHLGWEK